MQIRHKLEQCHNINRDKIAEVHRSSCSTCSWLDSLEYLQHCICNIDGIGQGHLSGVMKAYSKSLILKLRGREAFLWLWDLALYTCHKRVHIHVLNSENALRVTSIYINRVNCDGTASTLEMHTCIQTTIYVRIHSRVKYIHASRCTRAGRSAEKGKVSVSNQTCMM